MLISKGPRFSTVCGGSGCVRCAQGSPGKTHKNSELSHLTSGHLLKLRQCEMRASYRAAFAA